MARRRVSHVPTNVITGFLGVGKSTAVRSLLDRAPDGERWAVLVNEFGEVAVDGAALDSGKGEAVIRELPGGCMCCTMGAPLEVTLARLLREARPDRLLIEPTGVGHPARVLDTLRGDGLGEALDVRATVCLVDPRRLAEDKVMASEVFRDQVELADVLVANKTDVCARADLERFQEWAHALFPPKARVEAVRDGRIDPAWLDIGAHPGRKALFPEAHHHHDHREEAPEAEPEPGRHVRQENRGQGLTACGWRFHPGDCFDQDHVAEVLRTCAPGARVKGVFHCDNGWFLFDRADGALSVRASSWRTDSRVECIADDDTPPDWDAVEAALKGARLIPVKR
ncbi:GTP-binding protein [Aquisalimonas sp.]|uniref:CobW family GTP-binding protein n=1 Tax=unclassified Aquisalimonas TaxID=2644645 RepID=UPI0025C2E20F|nr:GTP-binding protein [Aquisalimonas sp.]